MFRVSRFKSVHGFGCERHTISLDESKQGLILTLVVLRCHLVFSNHFKQDWLALFPPINGEILYNLHVRYMYLNRRLPN